MEKFDALRVAYELMRTVSPVLELIAERDANLADQARRATTSIVLNLEEGQLRRGKDRARFHRQAGGSSAELRAALRIANAWGYTHGLENIMALADRVVAMTYRLAHPLPRSPGHSTT